MFSIVIPYLSTNPLWGADAPMEAIVISKFSELNILKECEMQKI
jgi:hypothetical protein